MSFFLPRRSSALQVLSSPSLDRVDSVEESARHQSAASRARARLRLRKAGHLVKNALHFAASARHGASSSDEGDDEEEEAPALSDVEDELDLDRDRPPPPAAKRDAVAMLLVDALNDTLADALWGLPNFAFEALFRVCNSLRRGLGGVITFGQVLEFQRSPGGFLTPAVCGPALCSLVALQLLESSVTLLPMSLRYCEFRFAQTGPMVDGILGAALPAILAVAKVCAEVAVARSFSKFSSKESFGDTVRSIQPWVLLSRFSWSFLPAVVAGMRPSFKTAKRHCNIDWIASIAPVVPLLMPRVDPGSERMTIKDYLNVCKARPRYMLFSLCLTLFCEFGDNCDGEDRPHFAWLALRLLLENVPWFLVGAMNFHSNSLTPGLPGDRFFQRGLVLSALGVFLEGTHIRVYKALRSLLFTPKLTNLSQSLLRKFRHAELGPRTRGHISLRDIPEPAANVPSLARASSASQPRPPPPPTLQLTRQSTVTFKTAALPTLSRKRRALLSRLRSRYSSRVDALHSVPEPPAPSANFPEAALLGSSAEALVFYDQSVCQQSDSYIVACRSDPLPSLQTLALVPRHALVAQHFPIDPETGELSPYIMPARFVLRVHFIGEGSAADVGGVFRDYLNFQAAFILNNAAKIEDFDALTPKPVKYGGWVEGDEVRVHSVRDTYLKAKISKVVKPNYNLTSDWRDSEFTLPPGSIRPPGPLGSIFYSSQDGGLLPKPYKVPDRELELERRAVREQEAAKMIVARESDGFLVKLKDRLLGKHIAAPAEPVLEPLKNDELEEMLRWNDNRLALFAIGRLMALAIIRNTPFECPFSRCIYKILVGETFTPRDVSRIDPDFQKHRVLPLLADGGVAAMEGLICDDLFFVDDAGVELLPGGKTKRVTERNKKKYLRLLTEQRLVGHCRRELSYIAKGFFDVIPQSVLSSKEIDSEDHISAVDLDLLVSGLPGIDVNDWRTHSTGTLSDTTIKAVKDLMPQSQPSERAEFEAYLLLASKIATWFWHYIESLNVEDRAKVLLFTCGSSRLPAEGFAQLRPPFKVDLDMQSSPTSIPCSHTCFNQLCIPKYETEAELIEKMGLVIKYAGDGFGFI